MTHAHPPADETRTLKPEARSLRANLVRTIRGEARSSEPWTGRDHFSKPVLSAIARVPREDFTPKDAPLRAAYANRPMPIGCGQTISQPYIVALMTDLLNLKPTDRVLEVGTGSGYQTAVLSHVAGMVYTIERHKLLADTARDALHLYGRKNIHFRLGDGALGWAEYAPFDAVMVTAAAAKPIPPALIEQLAPGGRLIIPLGPLHGPQMLTLGVKDRAGKFISRSILPVAFVPLVSDGLSGLEN